MKPELDYTEWLARPLRWLREHDPDRLDAIYVDGRLVQTAESARSWVELLER